MNSEGLWFRTACRRNELQVSDDQVGLLTKYVELLLSWNKSINLISRRDETKIWQNHILHSASLLFRRRFPPESRVLDLGTGGGLPGIPLKILDPSLSLVLLDSTQKKVKAVTDIISKLQLENAHPLWGRAEDVAKQKGMDRSFTHVVARAVAPLADLIRLSFPFLTMNRVTSGTLEHDRIIRPGSLIAYKGGLLDEELRTARLQKNVNHLEMINLAFDELAEVPLVEKKIVIVELSNEKKEHAP